MDIPESNYLVFSYPPFDFMTENAEVMSVVENLAWNFEPAEITK